MSHVTCPTWVMSRVLYESCHMSHMSHATCPLYESCHMSHMSHVTCPIWVMSHVPYESCHTSHMSHVTCPMWVMSHMEVYAKFDGSMTWDTTFIGFFCKKRPKKQTIFCERGNMNRQSHETRSYGVATISRLLKILGLFCKRDLWKRLYSAKETIKGQWHDTRSYGVATISRLLKI